MRRRRDETVFILPDVHFSSHGGVWTGVSGGFCVEHDGDGEGGVDGIRVGGQSDADHVGDDGSGECDAESVADDSGGGAGCGGADPDGDGHALRGGARQQDPVHNASVGGGDGGGVLYSDGDIFPGFGGGEAGGELVQRVFDESDHV